MAEVLVGFVFVTERWSECEPFKGLNNSFLLLMDTLTIMSSRTEWATRVLECGSFSLTHEYRRNLTYSNHLVCEWAIKIAKDCISNVDREIQMLIWLFSWQHSSADDGDNETSDNWSISLFTHDAAHTQALWMCWIVSVGGFIRELKYESGLHGGFEILGSV